MILEDIVVLCGQQFFDNVIEQLCSGDFFYVFFGFDQVMIWVIECGEFDFWDCVFCGCCVIIIEFGDCDLVFEFCQIVLCSVSQENGFFVFYNIVCVYEFDCDFE